MSRELFRLRLEHDLPNHTEHEWILDALPLAATLIDAHTPQPTAQGDEAEVFPKTMGLDQLWGSLLTSFADGQAIWLSSIWLRIQTNR